MGSAAKSEIGATYVNTQEAVPIQIDLIYPNHLQPATSIKVDNSTAMGSSNKTTKQKRPESICIWDSNGSNTTQNKETYKYTGGQAKTTLYITTKSTSQLHNTSWCVTTTCIIQIYNKPQTRFWEGTIKRALWSAYLAACSLQSAGRRVQLTACIRIRNRNQHHLPEQNNAQVRIPCAQKHTGKSILCQPDNKAIPTRMGEPKKTSS